MASYFNLLHFWGQIQAEREQTFGENACHPEPFASLKGKLREGSGSTDAEILPPLTCIAGVPLSTIKQCFGK